MEIIDKDGKDIKDVKNNSQLLKLNEESWSLNYLLDSKVATFQRVEDLKVKTKLTFESVPHRNGCRNVRMLGRNEHVLLEMLNGASKERKRLR